MSGSIRIVDMPDLGAVSDAVSLVAEHAGSGRVTAPAVRSYVLNGQIVTTGPVRLYTTDWLFPLISWPSTSSNMYVLSPNGCMAITGASDTAHSVGVTYPVAIGVSGFGFSNLAGSGGGVSAGQAWGGYFEGRQYPGANTYTWGIEVDICNVSGVDATESSPYFLPSPATVAINIQSGGGVSIDTPPLVAKTASAAIFIGNNEAAFLSGIIFGATALVGTNGNDSGVGVAINMATGHMVQWTLPNESPGPSIVSVQKSAASALAQMVFDNDLVYFRSGTTPLLALSTVTTLGLGGTQLELRVFNNAGYSFVPVTLGAPDSGGTGYRALRVPN